LSYLLLFSTLRLASDVELKKLKDAFTIDNILELELHKPVEF
jgi:hypothetical protein